MIKLIKRIVLIFVCGLGLCECYSQVAPGIEWQKSYGGSSFEYAYSIVQTYEGGFMVAGSAASNDGDVTGNHGDDDFWIVKLDNIGNIQWQKSLGGSYDEVAAAIEQTTDHGYIIAGYSFSNDGDVSGHHNYSDYWVVKTDSIGNIQWQKSLGGSYHDGAFDIHQALDGGYIVAGYTESNDGDVSGNHGYPDEWILKLDSAGNIQWQKCLGGIYMERAYSILNASDKGFVIGGMSNEIDGDVTSNHGCNDFWVIKTDSSGNIMWQKSLGGTNCEYIRSLKKTNDGGYIATGYSGSNDGDVTGNHGSWDYWVVKLDTVGNIQWQKSFGGSTFDEPFSIDPTFDGGYIVVGRSASIDGDITINHGGDDYWVVKLDTAGNMQWQKSLGGSDFDYAYSVVQTFDEGYVVAGVSRSNDGDVSGNHGEADYWIVKLAPDTITSVPNLQSSPFNLQLFPNPTTGTIQLSFNTKHNAPQHCEIINIMGEKVYEKKLEVGGWKLETTLNVSFLAKGIYLVRVGDGERWENKKLVIE